MTTRKNLARYSKENKSIKNKRERREEQRIVKSLLKKKVKAESNKSKKKSDSYTKMYGKRPLNTKTPSSSSLRKKK